MRAVGARARGLPRRVADVWPTPDASGWRQLPFTVLVLVVAVVIEWLSEPSRSALLVAAIIATVVVQALASLAHPARWPPQWRLAVPGGQMLAVCLLDLGSGDRSGGVVVLLFVPAVSLALAPGVRPVAVGLVGVTLVAYAPVFLADDRLYPVLHGTITALIVGAVMGHVHAMVATARRQEQRLVAARDLMRSIMAAATEQAIIATDPTGRVVAVSSGAEGLFETPAERLVGTALPRLVGGADTPRSDPPLDGLVGAAARGGSHVSQWQHPLDGSQRVVEYVVTARPPEPGTSPGAAPAAGYLVVATDVTEREEEARRQEQFIGLVSHELRTPLVSILGYVDLLRLDQDALSAEQREHVDVLARNARRLRALVDELLLSARVVAGEPMRPEELDVVAIVRSAVASVRPMADAARVTVELTGDATVPLASDPQRLGQVIDNLLTNAVKHSHEDGRVRVEVVAKPGRDGARGTRIRVADDGTGIAPDDLRRITEPFYRSRDTRRRRIAGVGLGLTLVQTLVTEHDGTLTIDSEPGRGTEVVVELPDLVDQSG